MQTARILVVDRERAGCRALRRTLKTDPRLDVVAEACSVREALGLISELSPDALVVADWLPGLRGLTLSSTLRRERREIGTVVLAERLDLEGWVASVEAGASGLIWRRTPDADVLQTVVAVAQGTNLVHARAMADPAIMARLLTDVRAGYADGAAANRYDPGVSARLLGVLDGVVMGMTNREIGTGEGLAEQTIKHHVSALMRAFGARDRIGILRQALLRGWASIGPDPAPYAPPGRHNSNGNRPSSHTEHQWTENAAPIGVAAVRDIFVARA
ncbi:MAG: response regulator [Thermomicrobiales bacterium]